MARPTPMTVDRAALIAATTINRDQACSRTTQLPAAPGVYAWYFDAVPAGVPTDSCHVGPAGTLLYVGISPGRQYPNSRQNVRTRVRAHYRGNAYASTLRLTLGCLLADELGLTLRRVGRDPRALTFTRSGEALLSAWMADHARVAWVATPQPWHLEEAVIATTALPLNLEHNGHGSFRADLSALRAAHRISAQALPVTAR